MNMNAPEPHQTPAAQLIEQAHESLMAQGEGVALLRRDLGQIWLEAVALTLRLQSMSTVLVFQALESMMEKNTPEPPTRPLTDDDLIAYV